MKLQPTKIKKEDKINYLNYLYHAFTDLKSPEEIENFLKSLLTESEQIMFGRRLFIAKMILEGKTYDEIIEKLHVGADTIGRVHGWLTGASLDHIKTIKNLEKKLYSQKSSSQKKYPEPFSFEWLKKRYPLHFLLFNLVDTLKKK